jgi:hypothetical protein
MNEEVIENNDKTDAALNNESESIESTGIPTGSSNENIDMNDVV